MRIDGVGVFEKERRSGQLVSEKIAIKALGGHVCQILLGEGYEEDAHKDDIHSAIKNFLALEPSALTAVEGDIFRFYSRSAVQGVVEDPDFVKIARAKDVWSHVQFGREPTVERREKDNTVYVSLECNCDWEPEHGLQIVFKNGQQINKIGPFDGHLTTSDTYGDASLEEVIYRWG